MSRFDEDDELYDSDDLEDYEDDDDDDECDEDDNDSEDEDVFETLEYVDTNQIMTRREIIDDIKLYLRKYQPMYKIVRKKDQ
jgi:hypothetical protein